MTRLGFSAAGLLAAATFGLLGLLIPLDAGAQATSPGAPAINKITARAGWLLVEWSAPSSDGGSTITTYDLRYILTSADETADANWTQVDDVWSTGDGDLHYKLDALTNDAEYDVQVRAVNGEGDGAWSATMAGTPELSAETSATLAAVRGDDGALAATWKSPTTLVDTDNSYDLRYIETDATNKADNQWTEVIDAGTGDVLLHGITGVTNGTAYDVQVRHVDSFGNGPWSDTATGTPSDPGQNLANARDISLETTSSGELDIKGSYYFWGRIDQTAIGDGVIHSSDWDYFKMVITEEQAPKPLDFQIFTEGTLDTLGTLLDEDGTTIISVGSSAELPNPDNFLIRRTLEAGTYYIRVIGQSSEIGEYVLRVQAAPETTRPAGPKKLTLGGSASGLIDPPNETDSYEFELAARTDVIIRGWGAPDVTARLLNQHGAAVAQNNDGNLPPRANGFVIRRTLDAGTYSLQVSSNLGVTSGGYTVYATDAGDPGASAATAQAITLGDAVGGNITSTGDADYFSITVDETTYVQIWAAPNNASTDVDAELLNSSETAVNADFYGDFTGNFARVFSFGMAHKLDAGSHYLKVTGDGSSTGKYTVLATEDHAYATVVEDCEDVSRGSISDAWYGCQWHLQDDGLFGSGSTEDINVEGVWSGGNLGAGITVAVVDDGMHHQHEDLTDNVDRSKNRDYTNLGDIYHPFRTHGTLVAGIIAARDNSKGMRGVAPRATIYGYNLLAAGALFDEMDAISRNAETTAVSNNSWGYGDDGAPEYAIALWDDAIENSVTSGYGGKGVFYVWSAGNGGDRGDYSTLDERNNFYAVTAACAVNPDGKRAYYSEKGANLWVCAPSDDSGWAGIATTTNSNRYTTGFGGTSAAAPIVSGVAALVRKANNALTWRDVKLILAASARKNDPHNGGWETGGSKYGDTGTYNFNHEYGFGVVDAQAAVNLANGWTNLPGLRKSTVESGTINMTIPDATATDHGTTVTSKLTLDSGVEFIEYIHVTPHFGHRSFRHLDVELVSPAGNVSKLAPYFDQTAFGSQVPPASLNNRLRLGSAKHLGESAEGEWTLRVTDHISGTQGTLKSWSITVFGHGDTPTAPVIDKVKPASGGFTVDWETPADPGASVITGYQVHHIRSDATDKSDGQWASATTGSNARQYAVSGLDGAVEYDVRVRAVNAEGDGTWSPTSKVSTGSTDAPTITSVTSVGQTLIVKWTPPADSSLGTVTSYDLRRKFSNLSNWTTVDAIWATGDGTLEHTHVPSVYLGHGRSHDVQLRAVVGSTEHPWSTSSTVVTVPSAPTITHITTGAGKMDVAWAVAVSVSPVTSYDVRYIESAASSSDKADPNRWKIETGVLLPGSPNRPYTIDGLTNWVQYDVQVRGLNVSGPGPWSDTETGTPTNTGARVTLQWEETSVNVSEDGGSVTLKAVATTDRDEALPSDFSFGANVTTEGETATESDDYVPPSDATLAFEQSDFERVLISGGYRYQATREFTVAIVSDDVDENDETFTATLDYTETDATNLLGGNSVARVIIIDNEHVPVTLGWLDDAVSVNEGSSTVRLNATATTTVDKRPESGFSFQATAVTTPGTADAADDYTPVSNALTFEQSDFRSVTVDGNRRYRATKSVSVPIVNDTDDERDENFTTTVSYVDPNPPHLQGGPATATVTIVDNDLPTVSIERVTASAREGQSLQFRLTREGVTDDALTVNVRASETRRMLASSRPTTATFNANSSTTTFDVPLDDDTQDEDSSVVTATVQSGSGYVIGTESSAQATALDNDHVPVTLSWDPDAITVADGAGAVTLRGVATTTKDKQPEIGFSFVVEVTFTDGTADSNDYFAQTQRRTFSQSDFVRRGQIYRATKEFTAFIATGGGDEEDETFTASLAYVGSDPLPPHLQGSSATATITITVVADNVAPVFDDSTSTTRSIDENSSEGALVGAPVAATDLNDDTLTYSIDSQQGGPYTVDNTTGQIRVGAGAALDYERRTTQRVNLRVEDPHGLSDTIAVHIEIANVNEPPVISGSEDVDWQENRTGNITRYTAADPERHSVEWSVRGTDASFFTIDSSGYLTFDDPPDFESGRSNVYELTVVATDTEGISDELEITVTVTDVNEPPTVNGRDELALSENDDTFDETYFATDPEGARTTFTWSVSGTDGGDFNINQDGVLTFRNTPDFERPADSNGNNEYLVQVRASDGQYTGTLNVTITVTNVNEPPEFNSSSLSKTSFSYAENGTSALYTYRATDPEGTTVTWSLSGTDDDDFDISQMGMLTFAEIPDFEVPTDANQDNEYLVTVEARDEQFNYARLNVTVNVTNFTGAEEPTITTTSNPSPYRENGTGAVYTFRARDPQGRAMSWSVAGTDSHAFEISSSGVLTFRTPPDFENPSDAGRDNRYEITVTVTDDSGLTDSIDVIITVTNDAEGVEPTIGTRSPPSTYQENRTTVVYTFSASDPQRQAITWTLEGNDRANFTLTADSSGRGVLAFNNLPNFETPADSDRQNDYDLTVVATDPDGHSDRLSFTITVTDVNEGPEVVGGGASFTVQENRNWPGATFTASDPEGSAITRWSLGGRDGGDFTITNDGQITFRNTPDFERPDDADRDNGYEVEVRPYDGRYYGSHHVTITVEDVTEITGTSTLDRAENFDGTLATYAATGRGDLTVDPAWRLTGTDSGDFSISDLGEVTFRSTPNYESPADSGRDNVYSFAVQATDGRYYDSFDVTVTVTPVNEPPTITTTSTSATTMTHPETRTSRLYTYRATDPEGATIGWTVSGTDRRFFTIDQQGQLYFSTTNPPDFEARAQSGQDHVYLVTVQASDGTHTAPLSVAVTVTDVDEGPEVTGPPSFTIEENQGLSGAVYSARDPEGGYVTRWSVGGRDGGDFFITQGGTLYFRARPDFERPVDSDRDNVYEVLIQPYDGRNTGSYPVTITVTDVNEPPWFWSGSRTSFTQPENRATRLYTFTAGDPEGGEVTWSVGGTDGKFFAIDQRGQFSFDPNAPPDFDTPADFGNNNTYHVNIEATDPESHTARLPVIVIVTEVNEGPVITRQGSLFGRPAGVVPENLPVTQALATYTASDPERPTVRITQWSTSGRDGGDFVINALGELRFRTSPNYEGPADSNRDNVYEVSIRASDGRNTSTLEEVQMITVTDVNERPTITTTSRTVFSQPENRNTVLYTFRATDPERGAITWSAEGTDGRLFTIDDQGRFSFSDLPDFEIPLDADRDNVYNLTIQVRDDAFNRATLDVTVTVINHNEGVQPTISTRNPPATYQENRTSTIYTFRASDPQRGTITWSLSGTDAGVFSISETGALTFNSPPDFENPRDVDRDNVYRLTVVATDDEGYTDRVSFAITVTNHNEGVEPTISTRHPPKTYQENRTTTVYTFRASDPQRQTVIWTLDGRDRSAFSITTDSSGRGVLTFNSPPDFESPSDFNRDNVYELSVIATDDDGNRDRVDFTITVTDVNEAPTITVAGTATTTVPENYADTSVLARYIAHDPENPGSGIFRWSTAGRDGSDFVISALGELYFRYSPDYERPADADRDNVYEVIVRASDGRSHGTLADALTVTVTNLNEAPVITTRSRTEFNVRENSTSVVYTYRANDQDHEDTIRWSVEGADGGDFAIYNGMLTFRRLPDLEQPVDADQDNVYHITVVASDDGGLRDTINAIITITDQSEGPVIAGTTSFTFAENYDIVQPLATYTATDAKDGRRVYPQWSLSGRDGSDFLIDRLSGQLAFRNIPDYDRPADADRDNVYELTIRGHDSRAYGYLNVVVTVTNINEGAPVVTGSAARTVQENTTSTIYTYRATDPDLDDTFTWSTGGDDGRHFVITRDSSGRGLLAFASPPDYENPRDVGGDNVYDLEVVATDAEGLRGVQAVTVTVTALNEGPVVSGTAEFTVNENQALTHNLNGYSTTYTATDPEAIGGVTTTITWSVTGRDGGDFLIDRESGTLTFRNPPNYEKPVDYRGDNFYELIVRAYDGRNYGNFDVTVTVLEVNEGPVITGRDSLSFLENTPVTTSLHTYRATDPEGDDFTWSLGGPDASDFTITTDTSGRGVLTFASPPNFDIPSGSGSHGNEYLVTVQARDDQFNLGRFEVAVTVTDQNEGAVVSGPQTIAVTENRDATLILATYSAIDPEGQPITRWYLGGRDGGDFLISENGELTFRNTPNYDIPADSDLDNEYIITVRAYDGSTYGNLDVVITVSNINEHDPVIRSGSRASFNYQEESTSVLYTYNATDQDKGDVITWTTSGSDGHLFELNERRGLVFRTPPDYENPQDSGRDNIYNLTVVATDSGGRNDALDVTVTVTAVDEGPEIFGTTNYTVLEGQELTGASFSATDPEDPSIVVSNWRTSGTDGGDFTITPDTVTNRATLSFRSTPDYDRPADSDGDNVYIVTIQVSDGRYYGSLEVTVTVTDRNESNPVVSGSQTLSVRENTTSTIYTYRATDADRNTVFDWSVRGTDGGDFDISDTGQLTFLNPPDHERPADSNSDNVYEITVVASDGSNEGVLAVTATVTAVNEGPEISGRDALTVSENHDAVLATYTGTDPENPAADITRWGTSGRDGGDFTINSDGELTFRNSPNFEQPADSDRDNVYELAVRASDGSVYGYYDVVITVEPVDEAPEFRSGSRDSFTYRENGTSSLYTYRATDPEGADVAWSLGGAEATYLHISESGLLTFSAPPNFENPARFDGTDYDNEYEVMVVATDQAGHSADLPVTVTVTDVNEGPEIIGCTETIFETVVSIEFEDCDEITVSENHDAPLYAYTAQDPEIPDLEITRWSLSGRDGGDFTITDKGELSFRKPPDSERPDDSNRDSIYELTIRPSDGRYYGSFDVVVTVEAVDEPPEFHSNSLNTFSYRENGVAALYTYRATDPEGVDVSWGLSGADANDFRITEEGALTFADVPDYEQPSDSNRDNVYELTVEASDESGNTRRLAVTVTVVNLTD